MARRGIEALRSVVDLRALAERRGRRLARAASVEDLRRLARKRLPRAVFDYIDGGAEDELTLRRNLEAFRAVEFRPRVLVDVSEVDCSTTLCGRRLPIPLVLAPTGFTRIVTPGGELDVARAAGRAGIPYTLSTLSTRSIEEVAAAGSGPKWFQVYVFRDRGVVKELLSRAAASGYEAAVLTVDTAVQGRRERDVRHGLLLPPKLGPDTVLDGLRHPRWTLGLVRSEPIVFSNVVGSGVPDGTRPVDLGHHINTQFDRSLTWRDLAWLRSVWSGPLVLKGVQRLEDARRASAEGVDAVALSNHGGRQLDGSPPTLELLAQVADAIGDGTQLICDGGVRRGSDIVKAVALGATACMVGRAYLYGLGAFGEAGVDHVLRMFEEGVRRTMALAGCRSVAELGPDLVRIRRGVDAGSSP